MSSGPARGTASAGCAAGEVVEPEGAAAGLAHRDPGDRTGMRRVRYRIGRHRLEAHRPRAGIVEHVVELLGLRAPVHRRDHHPRDLAGPVQGRGLEAVLEDGDQVVAVAQPHCIEPGHRTQRELEPVAVGEGGVAVDDCDGGGLAFGDVEEGAAEVEHRGVSEVASESGVAFRTGARSGRSVSGNADRDSARIDHRTRLSRLGHLGHLGRLGRLTRSPSAAPRRAPRRRWWRSRCTGTGARRAPRGCGPRPARARVRADR